MVQVSRVTFIHPDGRTATVQSGDVREDGAGVAVWIEAMLQPDWAGPGVEIVAAHDDGTVETAFEVEDVRRKRVRGNPHQQLYRVYFDY